MNSTKNTPDLLSWLPNGQANPPVSWAHWDLGRCKKEKKKTEKNRTYFTLTLTLISFIENSILSRLKDQLLGTSLTNALLQVHHLALPLDLFCYPLCFHKAQNNISLIFSESRHQKHSFCSCILGHSSQSVNMWGTFEAFRPICNSMNMYEDLPCHLFFCTLDIQSMVSWNYTNKCTFSPYWLSSLVVDLSTVVPEWKTQFSLDLIISHNVITIDCLC